MTKGKLSQGNINQKRTSKHRQPSAAWTIALICYLWLILQKKYLLAWKKENVLWESCHTNEMTLKNVKIKLNGQWSILLQFAKFTAKEGVVWNGQLGFVSLLWIDNSDIRFLAKIPGVKVFCSEVPDSNIVKWNQNCRPSSRISLYRIGDYNQVANKKQNNYMDSLRY